MFRDRSIPRVVDWDEEGVKDILCQVTDSSRHYLVFNSGTRSEPKFEGHKILTRTSGELLGFFWYEYHTLEITDWNNDGKKDLLLPRSDGSGNGDLYLFTNIGENYDPQFDQPEKLMMGYIDLGARSVHGVETADWNSDKHFYGRAHCNALSNSRSDSRSYSGYESIRLNRSAARDRTACV